MNLPPLTLTAIRAYVESLPPHMPCGERFSPRRCLVARYLNEQISPRQSAVVLHAGIWITIYDEGGNTSERIPTPAAIRQLLIRFDQLGITYPLPADVLPIFAPSWRPL